MTSYAEGIGAYGSFDDNPCQRQGDIEKTQQEQADNLRRAIGGELWEWLEGLENENNNKTLNQTQADGA